ncbi:MAG: mandelate racemase/muconate lactonizing enzyme family protein [Burkholderiales bacterium]
MNLICLKGYSLNIAFKASFRHASAERSHTQTLWVEARTHTHTGYGEGCPREYVTGETLASAHSFVARHEAQWREHVTNIESLRGWIGANEQEIDRHPAAWCAAEMALLDALGKESNQPIEALLNLPPLPGSFRYSAVLGDASPAAFEALLDRYLKTGFDQFKIKLSGDLASDREKVRLLTAAGLEPSQVRADANNLWASAALATEHLRALEFPFWALEEPLKTGDYEGLQHLARALSSRIILDESFQRTAQLDALQGPPHQWILNLRLSKLGGLIRSLAAAEHARKRGLSIICGAHVGETSLLTRAALTVAAQAQDALLAQEGAVGTHLLAQDVTAPPLMFGKNGILRIEDFDFSPHPGLGLDIRVPPSALSSTV